MSREKYPTQMKTIAYIEDEAYDVEVQGYNEDTKKVLVKILDGPDDDLFNKSRWLPDEDVEPRFEE